MLSWLTRFKLRRYAATALWPLPAFFVLLGIAIGWSVPRLESVTGRVPLPRFGAGAAQAVLSAFASGFITVIGLTVSIFIAVFTFGSPSLTPRIIIMWQRTQTNRAMVGILLFSVVYAFVVLGQTAPSDDPDFVPNLAVWLVVVLILVDVLALLSITVSVRRAVRSVESFDALCQRGILAVEELFPYPLCDDEPESAPPQRPPLASGTIVPSLSSGVIASVNAVALVSLIRQNDATLELIPRIGAYVEKEGDLFRVWSSETIDEYVLQESVALADERTIDMDPLYAIRLIVDIGLRALSPAINDPSTAVQALDRVTHVLRHISVRRLEQFWVLAGKPHGLIIRSPTWDEALQLSFCEIRDFGSTSTQVLRKLRACLLDLYATSPRHRRNPIEHQLELLDACVNRSFTDPRERNIARTADPLGLGGEA